VDGAHIRTLLLVFFYRYLPELIVQGRVYIAQPPLYKIKKGKMEQYLQRDEDKDRFLIVNGSDEASLFLRGDGKNGSSEPIRKSELLQILETIMVLEQLDRTLQRKGLSLREYISRRASDPHQRWPLGLFIDGEVRKFAFTEEEFSRLADEVEPEALPQSPKREKPKGPHAIQEELALDATAEVEQDDDEPVQRRYECTDLHAEAEQIAELAKHLQRANFDITLYDLAPGEQYKLTNDQAPFRIESDKQTYYAHSLRNVLEIVKEIGKKGVVIQRYKGLGEMNPQQLWETTMDPARRTLIKVNLEMVGDYEAEEVISTLMGDDVEKRRRFIQRHAPEVRNLDI